MKDVLKRFWRSREGVVAHPVRVEALIVEDKKDEADILKTLLVQQGAVVTLAYSIAEALECLKTINMFQLVFVDLGLPDGSGIEVVRLVKERRRMSHVIVVSGAIEKIPLVVSYGYIGILGKPYTVNSVGEILWKHRLPCAY